MLVLIGSYLFLVFVLPVTLSGIVSYRALPAGRRCPQCRGDTIRLRARVLHILSATHWTAPLHRRWCLCCGWEGVSRLPREPAGESPSVRVDRGEMRPLRSTQTLDVRSLDVDGSAWRVMVQCWTTTDLIYGRLVFVGPSGRLWLDAVEAFSASSETEILGQALSLPEPLLANRLRRLVSG